MKRKIFAIFAVLVCITNQVFAGPVQVAKVTPEEALAKLNEGNKRFVEGKMIHPHQDAARRTELTKTQKPFATLVSCSDSRVPPEIVFDQGVGDLFVVRIAGNVVDEIELATIEYSVKHLGVELIVILGHENCGAVNAAIEGYAEPNYIQALVAKIEPAVEIARKEPGNLLENTIKENIRLVDSELETRGNVLPALIASGNLRVTGAYYNLHTGEAEWTEK